MQAKMSTLLITGFGAFGSILNNPAAALAQALNGRDLPGLQLVGHEIPVEYSRGPMQTIYLARSLGAIGVLGIGVAASRADPMIELFASRFPDPTLVDNKGICLEDLEPGGPDRVESRLATRLAEKMRVGLSRDAGRYVCNAWLYRVSRALPIPVAFLHIPASGMKPEQVLPALELFTTADRLLSDHPRLLA
jgi:pyrrolidone-carboxylate peptidase